MSPQELELVLWRELEVRLRAAFEPRFPVCVTTFELDDVLRLCRRQLRREEFSPVWLEETAAELPEDPARLRARIAELADALAERVGGEPYVEDCFQVARYMSGDGTADRKAIRDGYWLAYKDWAYGEDRRSKRPKKNWGGVLGARLAACLTHRDVENEFARAKDALDARVFAVEKFGECAGAYRPGLGMKFENFFKRRIRCRAGDVARSFACQGRLGDCENLDDATLTSETLEPRDPSPPFVETAYRECLEAFRQTHRDGRLAARKIAALELYYKAYLDPRSEISRETLELVSTHLSHLQDEFDTCQCQLRDLEEKLSAAESACVRNWKAWQSARRTLDAERCSESDRLDGEAEASQGNRTALENELSALPPAERNGRQGLMLRYQIRYKALARARGSRERFWKAWEQWERCRLPWVRSQEAIAQLLGQGAQPTVGRHLAEVKRSMRGCLGFD